MKSLKLIRGITLGMLLSLQVQANTDWVGSYEGLDGSGRLCQVFVDIREYGNNDFWLSVNLNTEAGSLDTNIALPLTSAAGEGGECSFIAGLGEDTVIVSDNAVTQRRRFVEFSENWIQEAKVQFKKGQLSLVQFKTSKRKWSGPSACTALERKKFDAHLVCRGLKKVN